MNNPNTDNRLLAAAKLQEAAEQAHLDCSECEGQEIPELCSLCFPLYDDARITRRLAIAEADAPAAAKTDWCLACKRGWSWVDGNVHAKAVAEAAEWKSRWEAERRDHEATMKHCDQAIDDAINGR